METIVGIDLGTTNSEIAVIKDGNPFIIPINNEHMMPSCVAINDIGECIVGQIAKNQMVTNVDKTVLSIKRKMGDNCKITLGDKEFSPEEISSLILLELKKKAEEFLGQPIEKSVITVPAYFNDDQRKATKTAGELAGLNVMRIINEPTAAALAYETNHTKNQKLLVYDLGGGTFDVSVVVIENDVVEVKSSHGDTHLGGDDFDQLLINHIVKVFKEQHSSINLLDDLTAKNRLLRAVEKAKCVLSDNPYAAIKEEFIYGDYHLDIEISRNEFEEMIQPLIEKTIHCVHASLTDAGILPTDLDHIILVGGSTRIPLVTKILEQETKKEPISAVNPDLIVAMGAAIQAGTIAGEKNQAVLVDITPHTFGVLAIGIVEDLPSYDMFVPIIKRNTPIPTQKSEMFYSSIDNQETILVSVFEGENKSCSQNNFIGKFLIEGLSKVPQGNEIICKLSLDLNGILEVTAVEKRTGLSKTISMKAPSKRGVFDIHKAHENIESLVGKNGDSDLEKIKSKQIMEAKSLKKRAESIIETLDQEDAHEILNILSKSKNAILENDLSTLEELNESLSDMLFYLEV